MTAILYEAARERCAGIGRRSARQRAAAAAGRLFAVLGRWHRRAHDRTLLAGLDDRMLADIGISRAEAEFLSNKPFWRE
jgi:uncharacterized protein YjiS (DUF1127 family)